MYINTWIHFANSLITKKVTRIGREKESCAEATRIIRIKKWSYIMNSLKKSVQNVILFMRMHNSHQNTPHFVSTFNLKLPYTLVLYLQLATFI